MDNLSLADLTVFARAAALGTLSLAARERGVPVSQISRTVARVESACGVQLFRRSARGIMLTQDGEAFLAFCQKVLDTRSDLEADLSRSRRLVSGCVRVNLSSAIAQHWVTPSLPHLAKRHPELGLNLQVEDGLVDLARTGVDIAIRTGNPTALTLVARKLGVIETGLYASEAYLHGRNIPCSADDLMEHTLLANCEHPVLNRLCFADGRHLMANSRMREQHWHTCANGRRGAWHRAFAGKDGAGFGRLHSAAPSHAGVPIHAGTGVGANAPRTSTPATYILRDSKSLNVWFGLS